MKSFASISLYAASLPNPSLQLVYIEGIPYSIVAGIVFVVSFVE
jgi:hypothetical protein